MLLENAKIAIIGLGYVGLPLAVEFGKKYSVIGYDINSSRVEEINKGIDSTLEIDEKILKEVINKKPNNSGLLCSSVIDTLLGLEYIITYKADNSKKVDDSKTVMTHYAVYFEDGTLLDTSILKIAEQYQTVNIVKKNQGGYSPIAAKIGPEDSMIPGFKEGLKLLNVGDKATLYLPYYLAYGEMGRSPQIPPKSNLIFEVEIIDLK